MKTTLLLLTLALCACEKAAPVAPPPAPAPETAKQVTPVDVGAASPPENVRAHMQEHWGLAIVIRDAVIAATLDELPDVAGELADHKAPDALAAFSEPVSRMRSAAERAQKAGDLATASSATADLARACGDCHLAAGAAPSLPSEDLPPGENSTKAHMLQHDWAARELWAGLVIPSDERWARGAAGLAHKPLEKGDFFEDWEVTDGLIALDDNVHKLRARVAAAATRDERTAVYAELISNCAACHGATATGPVD